jgi:hypothetical protein
MSSDNIHASILSKADQDENITTVTSRSSTAAVRDDSWGRRVRSWFVANKWGLSFHRGKEVRLRACTATREVGREVDAARSVTCQMVRTIFQTFEREMCVPSYRAWVRMGKLDKSS